LERNELVLKENPTRSRRHASPEARRAQILVAALRCFSERGYHEATMDDVAREAGLSKGSLYWHFPSKGELFAGLCQAYALELFETWQELGRHDGPVVDLLERIGKVSLAKLAGQGDLLRAWAEFITHREVQELFAEIYRESRRELCEWIERGVTAGELRPLDPESIAASLTAVIEGLLIQNVVDPDFDTLRHWGVAWEIFSKGIAA
jgi:AcrR family transcriptional regulator